jgi:chromosome segregation ATPase
VSDDLEPSDPMDPIPAGAALVEWRPPATAPVRSRRKPHVVPVLGSLLVLVIGLAGYLLVATLAHQRASEQWHELAQRKADELAVSQQDLTGARSELAAVRDQLATATQRITQLADEKAQAGDKVAAQQKLADYQQRISAAAASVASALDRCVTSQQTLIGYLGQAASYSSADLARYSADVGTLCRSAQDANAALQTELSR